ncbi:MAG TPA: Clp protease N-terminal domain-containing protein [Candidatus Gastranaerophilales bacterium]|nr:Clp protease N-terminal domain-containing protein [Candidatus Gastranaerophilales bacterium]
MIERYTEKAIKIILFAQEEAFIAKHDKLYPEHILLGIVRDSSGLSSKLLKSYGLELDVLRQAIYKRQLKQYDTQSSSETMSFSAPVKKILREAWYEVQSSGNYYVTPENLLLSLLREKDASVIQLLKEFNVNIEKIKTSIAKVSNKSVKTFAHPEEAVGTGNNSVKGFDKSIFYEEEELKNLMEIAREKLDETSHEAFGTEQLVQAMIENKNSWISEILENEGINIDCFNKKLKEINSRKEEYKENEPEFTPKAFKALNSALDKAKELGSTYIKPEHVLLGILKQNDGLACKVFKELGVNTESLYTKIITPIEKEKPEILTIIKLAREEAGRMEQNIIGTEQILLGILGEGTCVASVVLRNLGITLKDARVEIQKIIGIGQRYSENNEILFTPRAKRIIALAWQKAKKLKKQKYTSEHLLLAITSEKESIAMKVLETLGVDTIEIRQGIINELKKSSLSIDANEYSE